MNTPTTCPKCGKTVRLGGEQCPFCGVIFAKVARVTPPSTPIPQPPAADPWPPPQPAMKRDPLAPRWWEIPDLFMVFAIIQFAGWAIFEVVSILAPSPLVGVVRGVSWGAILGLVAVSAILKALLRIERLLAAPRS